MSVQTFEDRMFSADLSNIDVTDAAAIAELMGADDDQPTDTLGDTALLTADAQTAPAALPAEDNADSSAAPAAIPETKVEIAGVLTKDGKHVIPNSVLAEQRRNNSLLKQQLAEANQKLQTQAEMLANGGKPTGKAGYSDEQLSELEQDFPQLAPLLNTVKELQANAAKSQPVAAVNQNDVADQEVSAQEQIDIAMAGLPLLSKYRDAGGVVWQRAVEIDAEISSSNAAMTVAQRFAAVEQALASELGIPLSTPKTQAAASAAPAQAPKRAAPVAKEVMPTLTDFTGSGVNISADDPFTGNTDGQMVDKAMSMNIEELRRMVGLS